MAVTAPKALSPDPARLNLSLSNQARSELEELAETTNLSITELVRIGLSLTHAIVEEKRKGNKLILTDSDGEPLRQMVIPGL